jgi:hypothetical protein
MFWPPKSAPKIPPPQSMRKKRVSLDDAFDEDVCAPPNNPGLFQIPDFDAKPKQGIKYDMEKPDYSLVPPRALDDTVKILTLGAQKYDRDNWKLLKDAKRRYFAAAMRHMWARLRGELKDPESGLDHCAHAICCLMFILELEHLNLDP